MAASNSPCLGCLQEDLLDAEVLAGGVVARLRERLRRAVNDYRLQQGQDPLEESPNQRQERLREERLDGEFGQAEVDRITAVIAAVRSTVPAKSRRTTCPSCAPRKRDRKTCAALSQRLASGAAERQELEADREAWIREQQSPPANGMPDEPGTGAEDSGSDLFDGGDSSV